MQATRVRQDTAVSTATTQDVTQKQSTQIAQTLLHSSISELLHMRLLLPDESFTDIAYPVKADIDYEAFARGELSGGHAARGPKTNVHLILRNKTPGGDLVLDWLQKGAFEALQRKWLRALQLNVHTDSQEPRRIVEAYTFSFAYADHADDGSLVSISFSSRQGRKTELKDIRYALHGFLRQLVGICRTLPQLPDRRYLSMNLFYNDECPDDYQPAFFQQSEATQQSFMYGGGWVPKMTPVGSVDSGYHQVSLALTSLDKQFEDSMADDDYHTIPVKLDRTLKRPADHDVVRPPDLTADAPVDVQKHSMRVQNTDNGGISARSTEDDSKQVTRMRDELLKLLQPEQITESLDPTQLIPQDSMASQHLDVSSAEAPVLRYTQAKLKEARKYHGSEGGRARREESISTTGAEDKPMVRCHCGTTQEGEYDDLICCDICERWQHLHCHGYRGPGDKRIPSLHVCYACLCAGDEDKLQLLSDLSLRRSCVNFIEMKGGLTSAKALSEMLSLDLPISRDVVRHLKDKGYLLNAPWSKGKGVSSSCRPSMLLVREGEAYEQLMSELFNPTAEIEEYLQPGPEQPSYMAQQSMSQGLSQRSRARSDREMSSTSTCAARKGIATSDHTRVVKHGNGSRLSGATPPSAQVERDSQQRMLHPQTPVSRPSKRHINAENHSVSVRKSKRSKMSQSRVDLDVSHWSPAQS